jgi:ferrous iron transport protein B
MSLDGERIVLLGKESVGKSTLAAGLTGAVPSNEPIEGSTVACERYRTDDLELVDTPGITLDADTETTRKALSALENTDRVVLVVPTTALDRDLAELLPLVRGRPGAIVVTHCDKLEAGTDVRTTIESLERDLGVPVLPVDARRLTRVAPDGGVSPGPAVDEPTPPTADTEAVLEALRYRGPLPGETAARSGWEIEPPETILERPFLGPIASALILLLPAVVAVWFANTIAGELDPIVERALEPAIVGIETETLPAWLVTLAGTETVPEPLVAVLTGEYGLLAMGPFLFVWALPTMLIFALFVGIYNASGLLSRVTAALHPSMRRIGLTGRDLVRVVMGFGCNVPAVTSTRSCSDCTRCTTISAISFGAACSYQFPATLAVFAAVDMAWLVVPYLVVLVATTLLYVRLIAPVEARTASLAADGRSFLERPRPRAVWREACTSLSSFVTTALPVFAGICVAAASLEYVGALERLGDVLAPAMGSFGLPAEAALPVVLASIRKDGIALLSADSAGIATLSPVQILVAVYLAGVLLPCLVTAITVAREVSVRFVVWMLARQAAAAICFALVIAWLGSALFS